MSANLKYLSLCSGIEAATCAWHPLGWEAVAFSEIEKFPSQVLAHHYPDVPNWGDMTKFKEWPDANVDVLVGGTPCQSFSVAGLRKGLDDPRGNLMLTYGAIARKYRPKWVVWENVPGVLSSDGGRDFASFLGLMSGQQIECPASGWKNSGIIPGYESAYGLAWRVLDAQYFGVAQRRRRVFVVGYLGDWRRAAAVLFERHSLSGHPAPSREKRKDVAGTITKGAFSGGAGGRPEGADGNHFIAEIAPTLNAHFGSKQGLENQHIDGGGGLFVTCQVPDNKNPLGRGDGDADSYYRGRL
jgi:DNA (cytosine-5)-methyltransferase 1